MNKFWTKHRKLTAELDQLQDDYARCRVTKLKFKTENKRIGKALRILKVRKAAGEFEEIEQ